MFLKPKMNEDKEKWESAGWKKIHNKAYSINSLSSSYFINFSISIEESWDVYEVNNPDFW